MPEFRDSVGARTLSGATYSTATAMTDEACISFCSGKGYVYAGTEYGGECCKSPAWCSQGSYNLICTACLQLNLIQLTSGLVDCGNTIATTGTVAKVPCRDTANIELNHEQETLSSTSIAARFAT